MNTPDEPNASGGTARYEVLAGLPPYGPPATVFSATGQGKHTEGLVVRFALQRGGSWVGNFIGTLNGVDGVFEHPDGIHVIVLSKGQGYIVNPETQECLRTFGGQVVDVIPVPQLQLVIIGNGLWFEAIAQNGIAWRTHRISWDGMRNVEVRDLFLSGEAWDLDDVWHPFSVDLLTGEVSSGSYYGPTPQRRWWQFWK